MGDIKIDWRHVVVLGGAGKMGRGIALLLLQEMAGVDGTILTLLDSNAEAFEGLRRYLRTNLIKYVERQINQIRRRYAHRNDLIDNGEMIEEYVTQAMDRVRCVTSLEDCRGATQIFEAIIEDVDVKVKVLREADAMTMGKANFFTNTSSIPISLLGMKSGVGGRLIGFHFYNPPAVQRLLELIVPKGAAEGLEEMALEVAARLKKVVVRAGDVAGFIGNGHFIREVAEACAVVDELSKTMPEKDAIQYVNWITQDYLVRPMGIFQLIDYVGIDVCLHIAKVMSGSLQGVPLMAPLLKKLLADGIKGGQNAVGGQLAGFFRYEKGVPVEVYNRSKDDYAFCVAQKNEHGMPEGFAPWKVLSKDPRCSEKLDTYFRALMQENTSEAQLARSFLENSQKIAEGLVKDGIAKNIEDVDTVLKQGFYHLYGVDAPFLALKTDGAVS